MANEENNTEAREFECYLDGYMLGAVGNYPGNEDDSPNIDGLREYTAHVLGMREGKSLNEFLPPERVASRVSSILGVHNSIEGWP